jgi:hypothetical protein
VIDTLDYYNSVDYYNSGGDRVIAYLDQPIQLGPLASTEVLVDRTNVTGGGGANCIVHGNLPPPSATPSSKR